MPFTPFAGLGVMVHILIIAVNKIYLWLPFKKAKSKTRIVPVYHIWRPIAGALIVIVVFSAVLLNAFTLIHASLADKYSSITLAENFIKKELYPTAGIEGVKIATATTPTTTMTTVRPERLPSSVACHPQYKIVENQYNNSLVDYLAATGRDSSFSSREKLAESFGIENYTGIPEENQALLITLLAADTAAPNPCQK